MKTLVMSVLLVFLVLAASAETVISANITSSQNWTLAGSPYIINGNITITNTTNPIVTIDAGVEVKFNSNTSILLGHSSSSSYHGGMIVNGTADNPVLFTANSATPTAGFWNYIRCNRFASETDVVFNYAIFEYGGSANGLIDVNGGYPQFSNCIFRYSAGYGIYHTSDTNSANVQNCSFLNNGSYPLHWNPQLVEEIGTNNSYSGNNPNRILLKDVIITSGVTYTNPGIPYEAIGNLSLRNGANSMVLESGTQLLMRSGKYIYVGTTFSSSTTGSINAEGATFAEAEPGSGWNGIDFQNYNQNSVLNGCTIKNVNNVQSGAIWIRGNNTVQISNCNFNSIDNYAITCNSNSNFSINGISIVNCSKTISIWAMDLYKLGSGNSYNLNTDNRIHCQGGQMSSSCSWTRQHIPIFVLSDINFHGLNNPIWTIAYGSVIEFAAQKLLTIGSSSSTSSRGTLNATGVTFRGAVPSSGYWKGISFTIHSNSSTLSSCIIKDAGYNATSAVNMAYANSTITGCTIYNNAAVGINLSAGSQVSISGTVIFQCGSYPLSIGANSLRVLGGNNFFTGNAIDKIEVRSETVSTSGTWRNPGVPYYFTASTSIYSPSPYVHIKAMPGVIIQLPHNSSLNIGSSSSSSSRGSLEADGVTFTRSEIAAIPTGLIFNQYVVNESTLLKNCTLQYLKHATQNCAVYVVNSSPSFEGCTFIDNPGGAIKAPSSSRPSVVNCNFINNNGYPIITSAPAFDVVSGVGNYFSGNNPNRILISGGTLTQNTVWDNPSIPVEVSSDISVNSTSHPLLKMNSGLTMLFQSGTGMQIGSTSNSSSKGSLQAEGVTLSALNGTTGGWKGLQFNNYIIAGSTIQNCIIEYAGVNGNIYLNSSTIASIDGCVIRYGETGIKLSGASSSPVITRNHILSNVVGIHCANNANPFIGGALGDANAIVGNTSFGIQNTGTPNINATYNWWGDVNGPTVRNGDSIIGNITYIPWRTTNIGDAPARFHLLSPANTSVVETLTPVIDWEEAIDPTPGDIVSYTLQIAENSGFTQNLITIGDLLMTVYHVPSGTLDDDTRYYWRVKASDTQGQDTNSYEQYFYFDTAVPEYPGEFTILCPSVDETVYVTSPLLSWQAAIDPDPGDVVTYTIYRDISAEFSAPDSLVTNATSIYSEFCQPGTLYYWQVKASDITGRATFSPLARFYTDLSATPRSPVYIEMTMIGQDLNIQWDTVPGADNYIIFHSLLPDSGFTQIGTSETTGFTHMGAALQARGFYRIVAEDFFRRK